MATALIISAVRITMPEVGNFKAELERKISQTIHVPVHIGKLTAKMRFFSPGIVLEDIQTETGEQGHTPEIQLKEVRISISLLEVLTSFDLLASTNITLVGVKIDIIRDIDGSLNIKGLDKTTDQPLWLLEGNQYQILQSDVSWQDLKNNSKRVYFKDVDLLLKNHNQEHEIHLLTTLPEVYGDSLRISALIKGNVFTAKNTDGQVYLEAVNLQGPALSNDDWLQGFKIQSGTADVKLWSQWKNSGPYRFAGSLQSKQINIANAQGKSVAADALNGNISWIAKPDGWRLSAYDIDMVAADKHWSNGEFSQQQDNNGNRSGIIKQLDIAMLAHVAPLFLPENISRDDWTQFNPSGQIRNLTVFSQADFKHFALNGEFSQLSVNQVKSIPGLQSISGRIAGDDQRGLIEFSNENILLNAPDIFRNDLTIKHLQGSIDWQQDTANWTLSSRDFAIDSPDFQTQTDFDLILPKDHSSPKLDLQTSFGNLPDVSVLPRYYPAKLMDKDATKWMDQAFVAGKIDQGEIVFRGKLDEFPFDNGSGLFETIFTVKEGELQFHPDWPLVKDLNADIHYLGKNLRVAINSGHSENVDIKQMLISINSLPISERAQITGLVESKIQNALTYLQKTPLHPQVDPLAKLIAVENSTQVNLDLSIPYHDRMPFGINVNANLNKARLIFKPVEMIFSDINGALHFSENSISGERLTATALGYPIQGAVNTDNTGIHLQVDGMTSSENLQRQFSFLHNDFSKGNFSYRAELNIPHLSNQPQTLNISSNLQGLLIDTQDFLAKTAEAQRPLQLNFQFDNKNLLPFQIHYGQEFNAALLVDTIGNRLFSGHIVIGQENANNYLQKGLNVEIKQPEFKLSQAFSSMNNTDDRWPHLQEFKLETDNLIWQGKNIGKVQCHFQHEDQLWHGSIESNMANGQLSIPDQLNDNQSIKLDMDYMNLSAMHALNFDAATENIESLPLIDINSKQLFWRTVNLGKLKLQTERLNNGIHFKQIQILGENRRLDFNADWIKLANGSSTLINGNLNMNGFGQFLSDLGVSDDFKETNADISFTGGWSDTPQQFSLKRLHGQLQIKLTDGRISSIEPGLGRLLGLISMEQWSKRLNLDFSDIYRQGLAFDKITGSFKINNGIASTEDLLIDAVAAKMRVTGTANLIDKTLNHKVLVIPKSSDALPIAGRIVGGIAEIVTNAVTGDYQEGYFFGSEYSVSGQWGNIEVTPVNDHNGLLNKTWQGLTDFRWMR
jgi:uncharacterized protein (TIGR02099 family)